MIFTSKIYFILSWNKQGRWIIILLYLHRYIEVLTFIKNIDYWDTSKLGGILMLSDLFERKR